MVTDFFMTFFTIPNQDFLHKETLALLLLLCGQTSPWPACALGCSWPSTVPALVQGWLLVRIYPMKGLR